MSEDQRTEHRARGQEFVRRFVGVAEGARDLVDALNRVLTPDARVHLQNGDVVSPAVSNQHAASGSLAFPDMEMELREMLFPDDRAVVCVRMSGSSRRLGLIPPRPYDVSGAFVVRITPELKVSELWAYVNPAFSIAFPPTGARRAPPPPDHAGEEAARALYAGWVQRAETGEDFVQALTASLAPGGVIRLANGDSGGGEVLTHLFARIAEGLHDLALEVEDVMFDGPHVIAPLRMSGVHRGRLGIFPPSGRVLPSTGLLIARADQTGAAADLALYVAPGYALTVPPTSPPR